jgi:putative ABC transport system permease protein
MVKMLDELDADVVIASSAQYSMTAKETFSREQIVQARRCAGVRQVVPLYIENAFAIWKRPGGVGHPIRVLAYDPGDALFKLPALTEFSQALEEPHTAVYDRRSKQNKYGVPSDDAELAAQRGAELSGTSIRLVGAFHMGRDFVNDGNVIMSAENFARYFPGRAFGGDPLSVVDLGIVRVAPGSSASEVAANLDRILPRSVQAFPKDAFVRRERAFWRNSTPIGYIFWVGKIMGFVVGVIICYQIIFSDIADHMPEFATLKAMGYPSRYFIQVVLQQSVYLAVLGFIPGLLVTAIVFDRLASGTGLLMFLTPARVAVVFAATVAMCIASGTLAIRKVLSAEPAELF